MNFVTFWVVAEKIESRGMRKGGSKGRVKRRRSRVSGVLSIKLKLLADVGGG